MKHINAYIKTRVMSENAPYNRQTEGCPFYIPCIVVQEDYNCGPGTSRYRCIFRDLEMQPRWVPLDALVDENYEPLTFETKKEVKNSNIDQFSTKDLVAELHRRLNAQDERFNG